MSQADPTVKLVPPANDNLAQIPPLHEPPLMERLEHLFSRIGTDWAVSFDSEAASTVEDAIEEIARLRAKLDARDARQSAVLATAQAVCNAMTAHCTAVVAMLSDRD